MERVPTNSFIGLMPPLFGALILLPAEDPAPATHFLRDHSQTVITYDDSPDIPFAASQNPYRGCEHGCA